ncbi:MAG: hypothetical protein IH605_06550 [Burkholderiales bacterium]|nr:hypothetical protein [Burkholderiales bacterium]
MTHCQRAGAPAFVAGDLDAIASSEYLRRPPDRVSTARMALARCGWLIALCALLSGCMGKSAIKSVESPERPVALASSYTAAQKSADEAEYQKRILASDLAGARVMRDLVAQSIRREIEAVYQEFESALFAKRAAFDVETDIFELLLSTATTLTGAERARTNLSALLTGTKGARLSVDKNVFAEKTYNVLVSQMRAARSTVTTAIVDKLARLDVNNYPLAEVEFDLMQLFNAGTLHEALVELSTQAGKEAKEAAVKQAGVEKDAQEYRLLRQTVTPDEVQAISAIRTRFNQLFRAKDVATAKAVLKQADPSAPADLSDEEVWQRLDREIRKAGSDPARLKPLAKFFGIEG